MVGRFRSRHRVQKLAPGARARQHHLVDLMFTDLRQLAYVAAGLHDVVSRDGLCRITGEFAAPKVRRGYDGVAPEGRGFALFRTASQRAVLPLSSSLDGAGSMSIPITPDHRARQAYLYVRLPCATAASGGAG